MNYISVKKLLILLCLIVFTSLSLSTVASASENKTKKPKRHVVIFSMPRLTWASLEKADTPNIDKLIGRGSIAAMSVRTLGPVTTPAEGYATISAGSRAAAVSSSGTSFVGGEETFDGDLGSSIYRDENSTTTKEKVAAFGVGFDLSRRLNQKGLNNSKIGSLADALDKKNKSIAVFGNADNCLTDSRSCFERAVAYVGTNSKGIVEYGDISRDLLQAKEQTTSRLNTDMEKLAVQTTSALAKHDVVVSECSDLERVEHDRPRTSSKKSDDDYIKEVENCDRFIGMAMKSIDLNNDRVYILSASSPRAVEQTTVFIAAGKSIPKGYATSSTTRRGGVVTLVDIAPSALKFLKVSIPKNMGETFLDYKKSSHSSQARIDKLVKLNAQAIVRDKSIASSTSLLVLLVIFGVLVAMIAYTRARSWRNFARFIALMAMSIPTLGFLVKPLTERLDTPLNFMVLFLVISALLSALFMFSIKKFGLAKVILGIVSVNIVVQFVDILFKGSLQLNTVFGYSPVVAGRFAGFGNLAFAIISMSAIVFVAMVKELATTNPKWNIKKINVWLIIFLVVVLIFDGAPYLGSDVGGVLALTPTIFVVGLMLYNKKISFKALLVSAFVTVATITTFAFIDLARPEEERTHLGRFASSLVKGEAGTVIERKLNANLSILTSSVWAVAVIFALLYLSFLFLHPEKFLQRTSSKHPGFKFLAYPGLVLGVLGMVLNDSGVAIPGMMLAVALPVVTLLSLGIADEDYADA